MNIWLIGQVVVLVALCVALLFRTSLGPRFQLVSMSASGLLMTLCVVEWLTEGARPWTIGVGVVAVVLFAIEFVRQARRSPN